MTRMLTVTRHGRELKFDEEGCLETPYVYRPLTTGQVYEEPFLEYIRSLGVAGDYLDVGAHLGTHTVWFATMCPSTHVHAFEPVGRYGDLVDRNIAANGLQERVTLHRTGVGDVAGRASNYLSPEHQVGFVEGTGEGVVEEFPVVRLDEAVRGRVGLIKLDVEGMEASALLGASRILSRDRPVVFAEAHSAEAAKELARLLARYGYQQTGKVFNASPTYEYAAPRRVGLERLRPAFVLLPPGVRRRIGRLRRRLRGAR